MFFEYLKFAVNSLSSRGLRSWLTMLGIFVGIAAVVSLVSLGQGLQQYINDEFEKVGVNRILINPGGGEGGIMGFGMSQISTAKLTSQDLKVAKSHKAVESGLGMYRKNDYVEYKKQKEQFYIFGADFDSESIEFMENMDYMVVEEGRYLNPSEKYKAIAGYSLRNSTYDEDVVRGSKLIIKGKEFEVVGFNKKTGAPPHDNKVIIPKSTMEELYGVEDELSTIAVRVKPGFNVSEVAEDIKKRLRRSRNVREGEEDFSVQTAQQFLDNFNQIIGVVQVVLGGIAAISLVVGGLGIMTTMYTSVLERTKQIGIMKAIGARNTDIMMLFLVEAGILGMLGGIIGVILGLTMSFGTSYILVNYYDNELIKASAELWLVGGALAFSFIVGCISGVLPSLKAARMKPVDAIRYR